MQASVASADETTPLRTELRLLAGAELLVEGVSVAVGGRKERLLLAMLAMHHGRDLDQDRLITALWGDNPPRTAVKSLHSHMWRLRSALTEAGADLEILTRQRSYRLVVDASVLDTQNIADLAASARQCGSGHRADAVAALQAALAQWRGRSLGDLADEHCLAGDAARLDELRSGLEEEQLEAQLELGQHAQVIGHIEALAAAHPLRERLVGLRMLALYRSARQSEALAVYQELRNRLRDEFGLEPSKELDRLEHAILLRASELDWNPSPESTPTSDGADAMRVMLVDDHPVWRQALRVVLERHNEMKVVAEISDGAAAVAAAIETQPAVVLMDLDLEGIGGVDATRQLLDAVPDARVLVLSASSDEEDVLAALRAGAHGYVLKTGTAQDVVEAVQRVVAGEPVFSPALAGVVLSELRRDR